ncbi:MAG: NINE protein [Gracilimonas sp.]|uniref:TM2 domain-containing protein n=1 Tax=Gracilimonas sp. TaxID=1974203 RepID=UPI00375314ED|nr:NINE protein [Gracilimonas sp.]
MRKSEEYEMALVAEQALGKALQKYAELSAQLKEENDAARSDLIETIHDSIQNLKRKIKAYFQELIPMEKVLDEFVFEYGVLKAELEIRNQESARVKKFAKKLLSSYEDFISTVGGKKKLALIQEGDLGYKKKSIATAYLFWVLSFFGILGLHRFYLGRTATGIGWLLTGGLLGFGAIYDLIALPKMVEEQNVYNELRAAKIKQLTGK